MGWQEDEIKKRERQEETVLSEQQKRIIAEEAIKKLWTEFIQENNKIDQRIRAELRDGYYNDDIKCNKLVCTSPPYGALECRINSIHCLLHNMSTHEYLEIYYDQSVNNYICQKYYNKITGNYTSQKTIICRYKFDSETAPLMLKNMCTGKNPNENMVVIETLEQSESSTQRKGLFRRIFNI